MKTFDATFDNLSPTKQKALTYIEQGRVLVMTASKDGIRLAVRGSDPKPYIVRYGVFAPGSGIQAECTCKHGQVYMRPHCSHVEAAVMLWGHRLKK